MNDVNTEKVKDWLTDKFLNNELSSDDLVQIIEHAGMLAQVKKISLAAKIEGKSYNGVKKFGKTCKLFGYRFAFK